MVEEVVAESNRLHGSAKKEIDERSVEKNTRNFIILGPKVFHLLLGLSWTGSLHSTVRLNCFLQKLNKRFIRYDEVCSRRSGVIMLNNGGGRFC